MYKIIPKLCTRSFKGLEQTFCKRLWIVNNDEEVYMQLRNIHQQNVEHVEVYYERLLKLANYLQVVYKLKQLMCSLP